MLVWERDTFQFKSLLHMITFMVLLFLPAPLFAVAAEQTAEIPDWLKKHVGTNHGQIAPLVLDRTRAHYLQKRAAGKIKNPCYFAMDATSPSLSSKGQLRHRFYIICEADKSFTAVSSGHGNGRKLPKANFSNGRTCVKNFSNAEGSKLTTGGAYLTAEIRTSFKGFYKSSGKKKPFLTFIFIV